MSPPAPEPIVAGVHSSLPRTTRAATLRCVSILRVRPGGIMHNEVDPHCAAADAADTYRPSGVEACSTTSTAALAALTASPLKERHWSRRACGARSSRAE
jgi:hypothetical protein